MNVEQAELDKFEHNAHRWWDLDGEFRTLHQINPVRVDYILQRCGGSIKDKLTLDVGCGGGILTESLKQCGANTKGIDLGKGPLSVAELHAEEHHLDIDYEHISVEALAQQEPQKYDLVTCMEMLEHVPDPASIINACATLVKPDGHVFFSTLNRNPKSYALAIVGAEHILRLLPRGTHDFDKFIKPSEMDRWIRQSGMKSRDIRGVSYNPLTGHLKAGKDVDVNYMVHTRPSL